MPTEYEFDVFISYSHKDEEWVAKTLLPRLENAELRVLIDFRDFENRARLLCAICGMQSKAAIALCW